MRRSAWCKCVLAATLVLLLALIGCGSATATTPPPTLARYWVGNVTDIEDSTHPYQAAQIYLTLEQSGAGRLTGSAKFCGGVYGIHAETDSVSGTVTGAAQVHLDINFYHLDGTYAPASDHHMALRGMFGASGSQVHKAVTVMLLPSTSPDYEMGCIAATPSPMQP